MSDDTDYGFNDREWTMDEIEAALMAINEAVTEDNLDEATLSGRLGYHIFATNDADSPLTGFRKQLHIAFDEATQQLFLDEDIIKDYHGEVTPQTICATVEDQMDDFYGFGGLDEEFLTTLGRQLGAEPDHMSGGKLYSDDNPAKVF